MPVHDWTRVTAGTFHDFHSAWIVHLKEALNAGTLPPGFYALAEQHTGYSVADVLTLTAPEWRESAEEDFGRSAGASGGIRDAGRDFPSSETGDGTGNDALQGAVALAEAPPKVSARIARAEAAVYRQQRRTITVRQEPAGRIVAMIEILSPGNKDGPQAVREFVAKSWEALELGIHLLVVDLFPPNPANPRGIHCEIFGGDYEPPADRPLMLAAYRATPLAEAFVEPIAVGNPLPDMPLFLHRDWYINVPLEDTYATAYRGVPAPFRRLLEENAG